MSIESFETEVSPCKVEVESTSALSEQKVSQDLVAADEISNTIWGHHLFSKVSIPLWVCFLDKAICINWPCCLIRPLNKFFVENPIFDSVDFQAFERTINSFDSADRNHMLSIWLRGIIDEFWLDESVVDVLRNESKKFASMVFQKKTKSIQSWASSSVKSVNNNNDKSSSIFEKYSQRFETIPLSIIKTYMILEALKASVDDEQVLRKSFPILKRQFLESVWFSSNLAFQIAITKIRFFRLVTNKFPLLANNKTPLLLDEAPKLISKK